MTMPGNKKIALNGFGRLGRVQANALLGSRIDCLNLRDKLDVPQIDTKIVCEPPIVLTPRGHLMPEQLRSLEQKFGIRLVEVSTPLPFPKDELLELKDKLYDIAHTIPKSIIPEDYKEEVRRRKSRTEIKKKKAMRRQQKQARRKSRK